MNRHRHSAALAFASALSLVAASPSATGQTRAPVDVYVLAGQSNMSGRGDPAELTAAERRPSARIRLYGNDGRWRDAAEPLDAAADQVDAVSADAKAGVGPGLFFARQMSPARRIALVPCAKGGSSIAQWRPDPSRDTLYGSCLARIREAGGRVAGVLWYQGESDARDVRSAERWGTAFADLVTTLRRDLAAPRLAIAAVRISDPPGRPQDAGRYPGWAVVQDRQARLDIPCVATVSSSGLPRLPDDLHLTTAAQRIVGDRLAKRMTRLARDGCR